ncbi:MULTISPECIES: hypothetical protein [unclassified Streptomyces]|uniref:hypothetical protein n=1 Tax=unclassified Streptomyces TaxID=2593676 RepID=UPI0020254D2A|nr:MULTISPECIES: hypothetical protein [unclassified Streptomyces]MCX4549203.1 hypothetical protein [Streptomyces sp. NBC_01500]WSC20774.1 hypothetical protein OIE60_14330 [Streptomyces sp. NBC_01766]WSV54801.1 hypothetical protein OG282_14375 [Streptomyces sp. NBC_01014]
MVDNDPRSTAPRALRASVGLTILAAALLVCGAAVEATDNLHGSSADGSGSSSHPATTVRPTHARPHLSETPSPNCPPPTSPAHLPGPTAIATPGGGPFTRC